MHQFRLQMHQWLISCQVLDKSGLVSSCALMRPQAVLVLAVLRRDLPCCSQVRLRPDERFGVVRFGTADAVQSAIDALHGTKICGEKIGVTRMDPLMAPNNSKRPRRAPGLNPADHMLSRTF